MTSDNITMIPIWFNPIMGTLAAGHQPGFLLLTCDTLDSRDSLTDHARSSEVHVFDMPSEARAAASALEQVIAGARTKAGVTPNGEGFVILTRPSLSKAALPMIDHRSDTGYLQPLRGSWVMTAQEVASRLEVVAPERPDLAGAIVAKIAEVANPALLRCIQNGLEALPGANVGMPALSIADLEADIRFDASIPQGHIQSALVDYSRKVDAGLIMDRLIGYVEDQFAAGVSRIYLDDEPAP